MNEFIEPLENAPQEENVETMDILEPAEPEKKEEPTEEVARQNKNDQTRYEYWQSQADHLKKEKDAADQKLREYEPLVNLRDAMLNDPGLLNTVSEYLTKKSVPHEEPLPAPPADFDFSEVGNEGTPASRYWKEFQNFQAKAVDRKLSTLQNEILSRFDKLEKGQQQIQEQKHVEEVEREFLSRNPEAQKDFNTFKEWAKTDIKNLSIDDWYNIFQAKRGTRKLTQSGQKVLPSMTAVSSQSVAGTVDENDDFNVGVARFGKRRY